MEQRVILVDRNDNEIGLEEKLKAHEKGRLHRAISVYLFNSKGQTLLQRRADKKYHSGSLWSNTCCTNCYEGETALQSAHRSLKTEMGIDCDIKEAFATIYKADVGSNLTEYEYLHVFFGMCDRNPKINTEEVKDWKWMYMKELLADARDRSAIYTEWLKILLKGRLYGEAERFLLKNAK